MTFNVRTFIFILAATLLAAPAYAQTREHSGHDLKETDHSRINHTDMHHESIDHGSMDHDAMMDARAEHMIEAIGVVKKIYKKDGIVSLSHDAIPAISWPPMTMKFPVGDKIDLDSLKKGQTVQFTLHRAQDGSLPLVELCPTQSTVVIAALCAPGMSHGEMSHQGMKH